MNHIILIGFMGAGKTSVGKALAADLGLRFTDTDRLIEEQQRATVNEIFERHGEPYFRDLETAALKELLRARERLVIAVGGGLPVRPKNRKLLKELGTAVYLKAKVETLEKRLAGDQTRPKLKGGALREKIESLMEKRAALYEETAQLTLDTDGLTLQEVIKEIETNVL